MADRIIETLKKHNYLARFVLRKDTLTLELPENVLVNKKKSSTKYRIADNGIVINRKTVNCPNYATRLLLAWHMSYKCEEIFYPLSLMSYVGTNKKEYRFKDKETESFITRDFQDEEDEDKEFLLSLALLQDNAEEEVLEGYNIILQTLENTK